VTSGSRSGASCWARGGALSYFRPNDWLRILAALALTLAVVPLLIDENRDEGAGANPVGVVAPGVGAADPAAEISAAVSNSDPAADAASASPDAGPGASPSPSVATVSVPTTVPQPTQTIDSRRRYTVQPGDSVSLIARMHGVTLEALMAENGRVVGDNAIFPGDELVLPEGATAPTTSTTTTTRPPAPVATPPPITTTSAPAVPITPQPANPTGSSEEGDATFLRYDDSRWGARSCAHKTIPLGITVTVTNLDNGRSTTCVVRDRGPFAGNRIIDLDSEVFAEVAELSEGVIPVRIEW
jgi:LysM repeat protein